MASSSARSSLHRLLARLSVVACALALSSSLLPIAARADRQECLQAHQEGQVHKVRGRYAAARERLTACADASCPKVLSGDCQALLAELEALTSTLRFEVRGTDDVPVSDVRVFADGELVLNKAETGAVKLDPGTYLMRFEAPGYAPLEQRLVTHEAEKERIVSVRLVASTGPATSQLAATDEASRLEASHDQAPRRGEKPSQVTAYVLGGTALVVLATSIGLGVAGQKEYDRCKREGCTHAATQHGRRMYIAADVGFGVAGGLAVAATWVYLARYFQAKREVEPAHVDARIGRDGATLFYGARF